MTEVAAGLGRHLKVLTAFSGREGQAVALPAFQPRADRLHPLSALLGIRVLKFP